MENHAGNVLTLERIRCFQLSLMVLACIAVHAVFVVCIFCIMLKYVKFSLFLNNVRVKKNVE